MPISLNFSKKEAKAVIEALKEFNELSISSEHQEKRWKIGNSGATLYKSGKLLIQGKDEEKVKEQILGLLSFSPEMVLGIDETGRGENFGSFVVAAVLADKNKMRELRDSKKIPDIGKAFEKVKKNAESFASVSFSAASIDSLRGKGKTMNEIQAEAVNKLIEMFAEKNPDVKIDGSPIKGIKGNPEFIVKGDDLNPVIGAASVVAKFERDNSGDNAKRKSWRNS